MLRNYVPPGSNREVMETGLYDDGRLILAIMAICSQTWQVVQRVDRDTDWLPTRSPLLLPYIRLRLSVTKIHVKRKKKNPRICVYQSNGEHSSARSYRTNRVFFFLLVVLSYKRR